MYGQGPLTEQHTALAAWVSPFQWNKTERAVTQPQTARCVLFVVVGQLHQTRESAMTVFKLPSHCFRQASNRVKDRQKSTYRIIEPLA